MYDVGTITRSEYYAAQENDPAAHGWQPCVPERDQGHCVCGRKVEAGVPAVERDGRYRHPGCATGGA